MSSVGLNSTVESGDQIPVAFNATAAVVAGTPGANEMSNIQVSIDGGAYASLPQNIYPGQSLTIRGDVGSAITTAYTANVRVGSTSAAFTATTTGVTPSIQEPVITSPINGSTGISTTTNLVSDPYSGNNNPGPHTASDWEVYEAEIGAQSSSEIVSSTDTIPSGGTGTSSLVVADSTNLDLFSSGNTLAMVDENGVADSYTPTSSIITNVETATTYNVKSLNFGSTENLLYIDRSWFNDPKPGEWTKHSGVGFGELLSNYVVGTKGWLTESAIPVPIVVNRNGDPWVGGGSIFVWYSNDGITYTWADAPYKTASESRSWTWVSPISARYWKIHLKVNIDPSDATESFGNTLSPSNTGGFGTENGWNFYLGLTGYSRVTMDTPNPDLQYFKVGDEVQAGVVT